MKHKIMGSVALTTWIYKILLTFVFYTANDLKVSNQDAWGFLIWFFLIICVVSMAARVLWADSNSLNPVVIDIRRFMALWSCSMILFRYLTRRIWTLGVLHMDLLLIVRIPAVLAPLLSILITRGLGLLLNTLLRNFWAEPFIRRLVSRKSTVAPDLSTAL